MLTDQLKAEKARLEEIVCDAQKCLENMPEGSLKISLALGRPRFRQYLGRNGKQSIERYLDKKQSDLIAKLAQKGYEQAVLKQAQAELDALTNYLACRNQLENEAPTTLHPIASTAPAIAETASIKQLYAQLSKERQSLVAPHELPDDDFARLWEQEHAADKLISSSNCIYQTEKGDMVRSKSEVIIADKLYRVEVPYLYEHPLYLEEFGNVHPDFTILNKRTRQQFIWEHFGLMDDPDYREKALRKIAAYARAGIVLGSGLIATFESAATPLDINMIDALIARNLV